MENREAKENEVIEEEEETKKEEKEEEEAKTMKPWEQHAGVINMPRYDYKAPSALLSRSHSGFLITCSIKREKSATKEALQFLHKYAGLFSTGNSSLSNSQGDEDDAVTKRRKTDTDENGNSHSSEDGGLNLSLVKLNRSGLVLLTFAGDLASSQITINVLSGICDSLQHGILKSPLWCHRIFPIQATCQLNEKELQAVVSQLVHRFMKDNENKLPTPVKFAIGYNRRGIEDQTKKPKDTSKDLEILDRSKCFEIVASSVKAIVSDSVVDLKNPDLSVLVELLPLYGVPSERSIGAVSVLPQILVRTKPRLCIRSLASDNNAKKGGQAKGDSQSPHSAN